MRFVHHHYCSGIDQRRRWEQGWMRRFSFRVWGEEGVMKRRRKWTLPDNATQSLLVLVGAHSWHVPFCHGSVCARACVAGCAACVAPAVTSLCAHPPLSAHHSGEECSRILYGFIFQALEATAHLSGWVWRQNLLRRGFRPGWGTARMMGRREGPPSPRGRLLQRGKRKELPVWPLQMWNQQQIGQSFIKSRKSNVHGEVA